MKTNPGAVLYYGIVVTGAAMIFLFSMYRILVQTI